MNSKQLQTYREELTNLAEEIQRTSSAIEEQTRQPTGGQADGGLSNAPMHLADLGTDADTQETSTLLLANERYLLGEVKAALQRLDSDGFGDCETCHKPISQERLEAIPYARQCFRCASRAEESPDVSLNSSREQLDETMGRDNALVEKQNDAEKRSRLAMIDDEDVAHQSGNLRRDIYAAGTAGGGTSSGGLARPNADRGDPRGTDLERAAGRNDLHINDRYEAEHEKPFKRRPKG